jgi:hypothetical protein
VSVQSRVYRDNLFPERWRISVEVLYTFGDFVTSSSHREGSMQDVLVARLQSPRVYRLPSSLSFKCNVLRESLSVDSQNIPCATLPRRGLGARG